MANDAVHKLIDHSSLSVDYWLLDKSQLSE